MAKYRKIGETQRNSHTRRRNTEPRHLLNRSWRPFQAGKGIAYTGASGHSIVTKDLKASRKSLTAVKAHGGNYE